MSNAVDHYSSNYASALGRWVSQTFEPRGLQVKFRLRGNNLHLLCQAQPCPDRGTLLLWLIPVLQKTDFKTLLSEAHTPIYRVQLYGCLPGAGQPAWTAAIHLNQLDRHLKQMQQGIRRSSLPELDAHQLDPIDPQKISATRAVGKLQLANRPALQGKAAQGSSHQENSALARSNRSLAQQGEEVAIASYLSETLSDLGVAVRVSAKTVPYLSPSTVQSGAIPLAAMTTKRLWISCGAAYSPDLSLVGEPITRRLRELEIQGYRDAVILFQVSGETQPDWKLRVDLTPPSEMLREWGRWGDVEAIRQLLNQAGASQGLRVATASLKESTLHLFCDIDSPTNLRKPAEPPDLSRSRQWISELLEPLAPQGIHAATLYGQMPQITGMEAPAWIDWLKLPAAQHPALSESAMALAQQGDWEAIAFLLHRLLNPDLDRYLMTGGIRLQLLPKQDLLHVMSEAPVCPEQHRVGQTIAKFLRQLKLPNLAGVRIYGRRSGQKLPLWSFGVDFVSRHRLVPEATPEFVATDSFVHDLMTPADESALRPDLTPADIHSVWKRFQQRLKNGTEQILVRSFLFTPTPQTQVLAVASAGSNSQTRIAAVWGMVGILLMLQANWLAGQMLQAQPKPKPSAPSDSTAPVLSSTLPTDLAEQPTPQAQPQPPTQAASPKITLRRSPQDGIFNSEGFTRSTASNSSLAKPADSADAPPQSPPLQKRSSLPYTAIQPEASQITAAILAAEPTLPSFNSHQMDEKLKLYYQYIKENGKPPDVLVMGSSRALRGIDPAALKQSLADLGYADLSIFNFGINGATAQVADLLVQQLLTPDQLPRLILWADGARAFNSGGGDVTFNGIAASEGYRQLTAGQFPIPKLTAELPTAPTQPKNGINISLTSSYEAIDRWFSSQLAEISGTYDQRDRLKHLFQENFSQILPTAAIETSPVSAVSPNSAQAIPAHSAAQSILVNPDGFLSLPMQFNPATYYQKYARVTGQYDGDYENFRIAGRQETALRSLLQYAQTRNIPVVFVNLPLTEDYLDPARRQHEQEFKEYMVKLSLSQPGFAFRDLGEIWTTKYGYFSDPSHLNRYGAYAISYRLAQDPLIPWVGKVKN
ncbi:MAG: hypothetical protein KME15_21090 [Drouetiella hepatica Uher 2000/2452]|jgi:hypothetical protein|uniref:DUF1574 domain-containing protein n=1 Tax=Drouetiella hepatica Uher 2000/2452 TaxID=904376 RepID=A0A951QEP3_9CYAN|nr:hypothetical protein [Drouetiella hepatica Uher 2000/2452]